METQTADRLSFRKFLALSLADKVPDETSLVRFRQKLAAKGIDQVLFDLVNHQLEQKGYIVKQATVIDATLVRAATGKKAPEAKAIDPDASYAKKVAPIPTRIQSSYRGGRRPWLDSLGCDQHRKNA